MKTIKKLFQGGNIMKQLKNYMKMINPFNNEQEMPITIYILKKFLVFIVIYLISGVAGEAIIIGGLSAMGYQPLQGIMPSENVTALIPYYMFVIFILVGILYCKLVEKRTLKSLGFSKKISDYVWGMVIGSILIVAVMGLCCIVGTISYTGVQSHIDYMYLVALFVGLIIQSMGEELLCRGFLMTSLLKKTSAPIAIFVSAAVFALPHLTSLFEAELGFAVIGTINLYLVSVIFSLLAIHRSNIWISCGLHGIWNFLLYGVFGLTLSGNEANTSGILSFQISNANIINGGAYGIEAGIATTLVLGIAIILLSQKRKTQKNGE
jgi:membrane protease YdiL (CAAX protease family)